MSDQKPVRAHTLWMVGCVGGLSVGLVLIENRVVLRNGAVLVANGWFSSRTRRFSSRTARFSSRTGGRERGSAENVSRTGMFSSRAAAESRIGWGGFGNTSRKGGSRRERGGGCWKPRLPGREARETKRLSSGTGRGDVGNTSYIAVIMEKGSGG